MFSVQNMNTKNKTNNNRIIIKRQKGRYVKIASPALTYFDLNIKRRINENVFQLCLPRYPISFKTTQT